MILSFAQISLYILICIITITIYLRSKDKKVSTSKIIIISLLFALYNFICTSLSGPVHGDRYHYLYEFMGYRKTSVGLTYMFDFAKLFSSNINFLYCLTTFICSFVTLYSFFNDKYANKYSLMFLLSTDFIFFSFYALKQCYVCAIASFIFYLINNSSCKWKYMISVILIYIACLFHSTGFILIPFFIILLMYKRKKINPLLIITVLSLFLLFSNAFLAIFLKYFSEFFPTVANKINEYFYSEGVYTESLFSFIKGFPFYAATIFGLFKYKRYSNYKDYDKILILSFCGAFAYFISFMSYWMYRITALVYLPMSLLVGIIIINDKNEKNRLLYFLCCIIIEVLILFRWLFMIFSTGGF